MISSEYVTILTVGGDVGMSEVHILKSVGDRTPPCGTTVFICLHFEIFPLSCVYMLRL